MNSGTFDIAQLNTSGDAGAPGANKLNYYDNNGAPPGQTFKTGSNPAGYTLGDLYYMCGSPSVNSGSHGVGVTYTLRIYSLTNATAGIATLISTYTNQNTAAAVPNDVWAQWTGLTNVLAPNSVYAYSISASSGWMHLANASNSPAYYNGGLGLFPTSSGTVTFATPTPTTDAVFLLDLVPAGYPDAESVSMSPTNGSTVYAGTPITFDVTAIGANIGYVWQINGTAITSSNTSHLVLDTTPLSPGTYSANVLVTNSYDTNTSAAVSFTVVSAVIQSVALSPTNSSASPVYAGTPITLSASVLGNNLTYYWQTDGGSGGSLMNLPNSNTNNFTFSTAGLSAGTYLFDLMVSNASGTVTSSQLTLYLNAASGPVLVSGATVSPSVVQVGNSTTFTATFTGSLPLYYQWYFLTNNGGTALIAGATSATYTLSTAQFVNAGTYYLQASNYSSALGAQTANSGSAQLYVVSLPQTNTSLATVVDGGTSPLTGNYDVTNLIFNSGLLESKYDPINPYIDSANPVGQIFKTGATPPAGYSGYPLNYVYFKDDPSGSSSGLSSQQGYVLFVYEMLDATNAQLLTSYFTTNTTTMASGDWIYIAGLTNILKLNTTYSVALRKQTTSTFYWKLDGTVGTDPFTDGQQLVAVPALGGTTVFSSPDPTYGYYYNTAFVMGLTPASAPQIVTDTTITPPSVYAGQGPVTMSATFNGKQPIYYHWQFTDANNNTSLIPGATNTTYTIAIANYTNAGTYALLASNSVSSGTNVASTAVTLAVLAPPDSFVINFSKPSFSGPGAIGTGSSWNRITGGDSAAINGASGTIEQSTVSSSTLDDGSTAMPIQFGSFETWEFAHGSGLALLDNYMLLQGQAATSLFPITFSNCIPGVYNVVFYGMDGSYGGGHTVFTVGPVSQTNVNTASSDSSFAPGNNYSVFYNVAVTNGVFTGYWSQVASGTEAAFNGAQLQMAYAAVNPHLFIAVQPADITVPVGFAANLSVTAQGPGTNWLPGQLFYQWWNASTGTAISGATNSIYPISTTAASTSSYYAVITNLTGLATNSAMVTVTIFTPDTLAWRGTVNSTWDFSTLNWSNMTQQADGVAYADTNFVVLDDTAASFVISNSTTLAPGKVVANNSVNNYLILGSGSLTGAMALAKNGNAVLTLSNYNTYTGGTIVNQGTLELATGGASGTIVDNLTINAGGLGRLTVADALGYSGSYVTNINLIGGTLTNASGGNEGYATTFNLTGGTLTSGGGAYNFAGSSSALNSLAAGTVSTILAPVALRANGLVITTAKGTTISGIDLSIQGPVTDSGGSTLTKSGNGTLSLAGTNTFNGDLTVNAGTLRMDGAGRLNSGNFTAQFYNNGTLFNYDSSASQTIGNIISGTGAVTVNGNGTLTLNGVNTYTGLTTVNAGTLAGNGTIAGAVVVNTGGTLAPGASGSGTLTISGNLTLNPGSTNQFAVNGTTPANAAVAAGGTVTYGGVLNLVPSGAFTAGQQFILFSGAGATNTGNFASIQGSAGTGLSFAFTNGVLSVVGTSTPFTGTIQFTGTPVISGTNLTIAATCSGSGTIYLLTSTNLTTAISQWTPIWTNVLTGSGSFTTNLSGVVQPAVPQKFYIFSNTNNY